MTDLILRQHSPRSYLIFGKTTAGKKWVRQHGGPRLIVPIIDLPHWWRRVIDSKLTHAEEPFTDERC